MSAVAAETKHWKHFIDGVAFLRLRRVAASLLSKERPGHTLQPTALVSEAILRLLGYQRQFTDRDHLFRTAAQVMARVLVDHGRARRVRPKCIAVDIPAMLQQCAAMESTQSELSAMVRQVFERLRQMDRSTAETVWFRCVEGYTIQETAVLQRREAWRVRADFDYGLQWMASEIGATD